MVSSTKTPDSDLGNIVSAISDRFPNPPSSDMQNLGNWSLSPSERRESPGDMIDITELPFRVGRRPENNFSVNNRIVSGVHAEFFAINDDLYLRDLNSTNGTFLNGQRVTTFEKVNDGDIIHFGRTMFRIFEETDSEPESYGTLAESIIANEAEAEAMSHRLCEELISEHSVLAHYQPIVKMADGSICGYEALCRSRVIGLETPGQMFQLAEEQHREEELSQLARMRAVQIAVSNGLPGHLYVNTHPVELSSGNLFPSLDDLKATFPQIPITLEVHEAAVTSNRQLFELRAFTKDLGIGLAYDDFGAGQSRLLELIEVPPDVLKFDMKLVQDLPRSQHTREIMKTFINIVNDLNVIPLVEGVETQEQARICLELGAEYAQGYFYGRPEKVSKVVKQRQAFSE